MTHVVTRQRQWPEGNLVVEISAGDINYTNPGALTAKYDGEFEEFAEMTEAVEAGIRIAQQWQADEPDVEILIATGGTGGMTMPFPGEPLNDETFEGLRKEAAEHDAELDRCAECGAILGKERYGDGYGEYDCCSEYCAEKHYAPEPEDEFDDEDEFEDDE